MHRYQVYSILASIALMTIWAARLVRRDGTGRGAAAALRGTARRSAASHHDGCHARGRDGGRQARPRDLLPQDRDLMPEHQDLRLHRGVIPCQEHQPAEHPDHEQADDADERERRA